MRAYYDKQPTAGIGGGGGDDYDDDGSASTRTDPLTDSGMRWTKEE